mmetsp:Transcript_52843/g.171963  ORF Transcript_52843/g.171963 Transcript_52843/m.171963 type:complete len:211 (+) Transcript_52843:659-1291(+)
MHCDGIMHLRPRRCAVFNGLHRVECQVTCRFAKDAEIHARRGPRQTPALLTPARFGGAVGAHPNPPLRSKVDQAGFGCAVGAHLQGKHLESEGEVPGIGHHLDGRQKFDALRHLSLVVLIRPADGLFADGVDQAIWKNAELVAVQLLDLRRRLFAAKDVLDDALMVLEVEHQAHEHSLGNLLVAVDHEREPDVDTALRVEKCAGRFSDGL